MSERSGRRFLPDWRARGAALLLLACAFLLPRGLQGAPGFGDPVTGQALFSSKGCLRCHAVRGEGGGVGPDIGRKAVRGSFFEIAAAAWNHTPAMGEKMGEFRMNRPTFQGSELGDLIAFVYFLNYFDEPGDARAGQTLFAEKHCSQCHGVGHDRGKSGPRLDTYPRSVSPLRMVEDLWNHGPAMRSALRSEGLDVPRFEGSEIIDLFAYLRSQGQRLAAREFQSPGDPDTGKHLFEAKGCGRCHEIFGKRPGIGPDLGTTELRGSVTQIAGRMWNHWPVMAEAMKGMGMPVPRFQGEELADLFAYLYIARYEGQAGDPRRGAAIYSSKGCVICHGPEGRGGIGPSLREILRGETKESIIQRMWNHAPRMFERMKDRGILWPRFTAGELADLFGFLETGLASESSSPAAGGGPGSP